MVAAGLLASKANQSTKVYAPSKKKKRLLKNITSTSPEKPSRISPIFYFGLEGLGELHMETDEKDDVCSKLYG